MKPGDLVRKTSGNLDVGEVGLVIAIVTNDVSTTIVTVNTSGIIKNWYSEFLEVINEGRGQSQNEKL